MLEILNEPATNLIRNNYISHFDITYSRPP